MMCQAQPSLIQQSDQLNGKLTNLTNNLCIIFWQWRRFTDSFLINLFKFEMVEPKLPATSGGLKLTGDSGKSMQ